MTYEEQLKQPEWKRLRREIFRRDSYTCLKCGARDTPMHCHHKTYDLSKAAWDYSYDNFQTLCTKCHKGVHGIISDDIESVGDRLRQAVAAFHGLNQQIRRKEDAGQLKYTPDGQI